MMTENGQKEKQDSVLSELAESFQSRKDEVLWSPSMKNPHLSKGTLRGGHVTEGLDKYRDDIQRNTLVTMENVKREYDRMDETTKLVNVGSWEKYAYPLIRAIFPNLILHDIVSVQPMDGPTALIFWMRYIYSSTKGTVNAGTDMLENPNADYASERIDTEVLGTGDGATANFAGTLQWTPVKPGTVEITSTSTVGAVTVTDDGNGNLVGDIDPAGANTVNYATGAYDVTFDNNIANGVDVNSTYLFDMEANQNQPEVDIELVSRSIDAQPMTLVARWSEYAGQDFQRVHGISAETELVKGKGMEMKAQIEMRVLNQIINDAALSGTAWNSAAGTGVSQKEHYESFVTRLIENSNQITGATRRAYGNWVVASIEVCNVIESLVSSGRFVPAPKPPTNVAAPHYIGMLDNKWAIYKHPRMASNTYLMGYKSSDNLYEVGHVYAPYLLLFMSPTRQMQYFQNAKGIGSRYANTTVDSNFYVNGSIT